MMRSKLEPTPMQLRAMEPPPRYDVVIEGPRGISKSWTFPFVCVQTIERLGRCAILYVRPDSTQGTLGIRQAVREVLGAAYPGTSFNAQRGVFETPSGSTVWVHELSDDRSLMRFTGQDFQLVFADQAEQLSSPRLLDLLRGSLRGAEGRMMIAAHPGGRGDHWIRTRYITPSEVGVPFTDPTGREVVRVTGTLAEQPHVDTAEYKAQLRAATAGDEHLARAWIEGDWSAGQDAFFAGVLDPDRVAIDPWPDPASSAWWATASRHGWRFFLCMDWGSAAPCVTYWLARSPGDRGPDGRVYPRNSIVAYDELHTARGEDLARGLGLTVPEVAHRVLERCARWGVEPRGAADPSTGQHHGHSEGSIRAAFAQCGVRWSPAPRVPRSAGWQLMRTMMARAGMPDVPGLYVSRACEYWWATAPTAPRSRYDPEDIAGDYALDHGADAMRYGVLDGGQPSIEAVDVMEVRERSRPAQRKMDALIDQRRREFEAANRPSFRRLRG